MKKMFFVVLAFLAFFLPASAEEKCDARCKAFKHPRERVLKPVECIPVKFARESTTSAVTIEISYGDGKPTFRDSKEVTGDGQFCLGKQRFENAKQIDLCDAKFSARLNAITQIAWREGGRDMTKGGIHMCLRGKAWCSNPANAPK